MSDVSPYVFPADQGDLFQTITGIREAQARDMVLKGMAFLDANPTMNPDRPETFHTMARAMGAAPTLPVRKLIDACRVAKNSGWAQMIAMVLETKVKRKPAPKTEGGT